MPFSERSRRVADSARLLAACEEGLLIDSARLPHALYPLAPNSQTACCSRGNFICLPGTIDPRGRRGSERIGRDCAELAKATPALEATRRLVLVIFRASRALGD